MHEWGCGFGDPRAARNFPPLMKGGVRGELVKCDCVAPLLRLAFHFCGRRAETTTVWEEAQPRRGVQGGNASAPTWGRGGPRAGAGRAANRRAAGDVPSEAARRRIALAARRSATTPPWLDRRAGIEPGDLGGRHAQNVNHLNIDSGGW